MSETTESTHSPKSLAPAADEEWSEWVDAWTEPERSHSETGARIRELAPEESSAIRRRARRFSWGLVLCTLVELVMILGILTWMIQRAIAEPSAPRWAGVFLVALIGVLAQGMALWNRRGTWKPAAESTLAFVEISRLRAQRQLKMIRFSYGLILLELVLLVPWKWWLVTETLGQRQPLLDFLGSLGPVGVFIVLFVIGMTIYGRRVRRQLTEIERLYSNLTDDLEA